MKTATMNGQDPTRAYPPCTRCGKPLLAEESQQRGYCEGCRVAAGEPAPTVEYDQDGNRVAR